MLFFSRGPKFILEKIDVFPSGITIQGNLLNGQKERFTHTHLLLPDLSFGFNRNDSNYFHLFFCIFHGTSGDR